MPNLKTQPKGYTMLEMVAVLMVVGIISTVALPSLLSLNNSLKSSVSSIKSYVTLTRSKAIASSQVYRIRPVNNKGLVVERIKYQDEDQGKKIQPVDNKGCNEDDPKKWQPESQFDYQLPKDVEIVNEFPGTEFNGNSLNISDYLKWSVCFNKQGLVDKTAKFVIKNTREDGYAVKSQIEIMGGGSIIYKNYTASNNITTNNGQDFQK